MRRRSPASPDPETVRNDGLFWNSEATENGGRAKKGTSAVKIVDIEVVPVQSPGRTPVPVLVHTDEGLTGLGEAGIGVRFEPRAAKRYPPAMTEPPHFHCPDGSFTNY